jgi:hypothetical protein
VAFTDNTSYEIRRVRWDGIPQLKMGQNVCYKNLKGTNHNKIKTSYRNRVRNVVTWLKWFRTRHNI